MKIIHVLLTATLGSTAFAQSIQQLFMDPSCTGPVVRARSVDSTGCAPLNCVNSVASGLYISQMCALNDPLETARSAFPGGTQILEEYIYSDDTCSAGGSFSLNALSVCIPDEAGSGVYFKFENMKATVDRNAYSDSSCTLKINAMSGYQLVGQCINLLNSTVQGPPDLGSRVFSFYNVPYSNPSGYPTLSSTDTASTTTTSALGYPTLVRSSTTSTVETASTESGYLTSTTTTTDPGYPTLAPSSTTTTETTTTTEPGYPTLRSSRTTSIEATTTTEPGYPTLRSSTTTTSTTTTTETTATSSTTASTSTTTSTTETTTTTTTDPATSATPSPDTTTTTTTTSTTSTTTTAEYSIITTQPATTTTTTTATTTTTSSSPSAAYTLSAIIPGLAIPKAAYKTLLDAGCISKFQLDSTGTPQFENDATLCGPQSDLISQFSALFTIDNIRAKVNNDFLPNGTYVIQVQSLNLVRRRDTLDSGRGNWNWLYKGVNPVPTQEPQPTTQPEPTQPQPQPQPTQPEPPKPTQPEPTQPQPPQPEPTQPQPPQPQPTQPQPPQSTQPQPPQPQPTQPQPPQPQSPQPPQPPQIPQTQPTPSPQPQPQPSQLPVSPTNLFKSGTFETLIVGPVFGLVALIL